MAELLESGTLLLVRVDKILTGEGMARIERDLAQQEKNRKLRLVVLQGAAGNFSYGASVEEHRRDSAPRMLRALSGLVRAVAHFPAPVAALVQGRCLGGGFELALACHLLFVTADAQLGCPEIKLGVFPPVLAALGPWKLGGALSHRMVLTGETIGAEEARPFATAVFDPEIDAFVQLLDWYRKGFAKLSAEALRNAVLSIHRGAEPLLGARLDELEELYLKRVLPSRDGNEGIEAFLARRAPVWSDE